MAEHLSVSELRELAQRAKNISQDFHLGDGTGVVEYLDMAISLAYLACQMADPLLEALAKKRGEMTDYTEKEQEALSFLSQSDPQVWTSIVNLCREHYGEHPFQSINYCYAIRLFAKALAEERTRDG